MARRYNFPNRKEARKASAQTRQEASDKLTTEQKLAKATPGSREYNRLLTKVGTVPKPNKKSKNKALDALAVETENLGVEFK